MYHIRRISMMNIKIKGFPSRCPIPISQSPSLHLCRECILPHAAVPYRTLPHRQPYYCCWKVTPFRFSCRICTLLNNANHSKRNNCRDRAFILLWNRLCKCPLATSECPFLRIGCKRMCQSTHIPTLQFSKSSNLLSYCRAHTLHCTNTSVLFICPLHQTHSVWSVQYT